jgi:hypothetical protein
MMEKMVNYRLAHELEKEKRLRNEQHDFRRGRSTEDVHDFGSRSPGGL